MNTYEITLDRDAFTDPNHSLTILNEFVALARDAGATFENAVIVMPYDTHRFGNDVTVRFDAPTLSDVSRYALYYDAHDAITAVTL